MSISLERFGDRWSLLIIRDLMVRGFRTFKEFQESGEGIASNILADRLEKLEAGGLITAETEPQDARRVNYRLTEKGIDLAPVMLELLIWGTRHEETGAPCAAIDEMARNRDQVLAEVRRRWQERDPTPFLPRFAPPGPVGRRARPSGSEIEQETTSAMRRLQTGAPAPVLSISGVRLIGKARSRSVMNKK